MSAHAMTRSPFARLAVAALFAVTSPAIAQTDESTDPVADESFGERIEVQEVLLDALVTDGNGNVVVGLTTDDFVVEENGEPVELTAAYFYSNLVPVDAPDRAETIGVAPGTSPTDRYFILFFHDQRRNLSRLATQQMRAAREAKEWLATARQWSDYVAVASFGSRLEVHQDFTRDTAALQRAVQAAAISKRTDKEWSSRRQEAEEGQPSLLANLPTGKELGRKSRDIFEAFELLSEAAKPIVGRKNMLLFTAGFGTIEPSGRYRPGDRDIEELKEDLNAANIAAYPIETLLPNSEHPLRHALNEVADATSGRLYYNFTSFLTPMQSVAEQTTGYYLLAYEGTVGEDGYREVEVSLRNPDFKVEARRGYRIAAQ